jgi:hypothetical protein
VYTSKVGYNRGCTKFWDMQIKDLVDEKEAYYDSVWLKWEYTRLDKEWKFLPN